jgi:hypothetical protein
MRLVPCHGATCKKQIAWAEVHIEQDDGSTVTKRIPLDASAPVYRTIKENASGDLVVRRERDVYVSHFATCRDSGQFSGGGKKG